MQALVLATGPFSKEDGCSVLAQEVRGQSLFEGASEKHGCTSVFLLPAIEVTMTIATWTGQVLTDLGVAVGHQATSGWAEPAGNARASSSHWLAGAKPSKFSNAAPFT